MDVDDAAAGAEDLGVGGGATMCERAQVLEGEVNGNGALAWFEEGGDGEGGGGVGEGGDDAAVEKIVVA